MFGDYKSGKSYIANKLIEYKPKDFIKFLFANKVKELFVKEFGIKENICERKVKKNIEIKLLILLKRKKLSLGINIYLFHIFL